MSVEGKGRQWDKADSRPGVGRMFGNRPSMRLPGLGLKYRCGGGGGSGNEDVVVVVDDDNDGTFKQQNRNCEVTRRLYSIKVVAHACWD